MQRHWLGGKCLSEGGAVPVVITSGLSITRRRPYHHPISRHRCRHQFPASLPERTATPNIVKNQGI